MKIVLISLMLVGATLSAQAAEVSDPAFHDFVYASVLDGLRQEKLPAEVVDRVLAVDAKSGLYVSFLKKCPVCEPVREAFAAYRKEAAGGAPEELVVALSQESDLKRTKAVGTLVRELISRAVAKTGWTSEERAAWRAKFAAAAREGEAQLRLQQGKGPVAYEMMWSCMVCDGAKKGSSAR